MVLVHKLKRMGSMNAEETRDAEEHDTMDEDDAPPDEQSIADDSTHPEGQSGRAAPPPHRPLTRSQTGHAPKRRRRHRSPSPQPQPPTKTRKRASSTAAGSSLAQTPRRSRSAVRPDDAKSAEGSASDTLTSGSHSQRTESDDATAVGDAPSSAHTKLTFVETSSSAIGSLYERRGPRARAALPVPVPNLTKKSRGRRVPTKLTDEIEEKGDQKGERIYVCKVENCGKCFHRGEHLKRHIRSIHTHEKPFRCTHPACDKCFNRHDNLLQHLRVHKQNKTKSKSADASHSDSEDRPSSSHQDQAPRQDASPRHSRSQPHHNPDAHHHTPRAPHAQTSPVVYPQPPHQPYGGTSLHNTRVAFYHQTSYAHPSSSFFTFPASYDASSSPSFATNMAVSSLRTEIPASPQVSRT